MRVEMELRNMPRFRIIQYLEEAGGTSTADLVVSADGWSAWLEEMEPAYVGRIQVPRDLLVIEGEDDSVESIQAFMRAKTMRGGG